MSEMQNFNPFGEEQGSSRINAGMNIPVIVSSFTVEELEGDKYTGPTIDVELSQVNPDTGEPTGKTERLRFFPFDFEKEIERFHNEPELEWARTAGADGKIPYTPQSWVKMRFNQNLQMWLLDILRVHVDEAQTDEIKSLMRERATITDPEADLRMVGTLIGEAVMGVKQRPVLYLAYGYRKGKYFPSLPHQHNHCKSWLSSQPLSVWPGNKKYQQMPWGDKRDTLDTQEVTSVW